MLWTYEIYFDMLALLITDPPCANSTTGPNPLIFNIPLYIVINSQPTMQFQHTLRFWMYE